MKKRKSYRTIIFLIVILSLILGCSNKDKSRNSDEMKIYIIPIGKVDTRILYKLSWALSERFNAMFALGDPLPLREDLFRPEKGQYFATPILEELEKNLPEDADKALGVVDVDIFVPLLNFIFGQADLRGKVCLISLTRLREEFYGNIPEERLFVERAVKEAMHELGHTFGLRHCEDPACVMHFSNSLVDTDRKKADFCARCRQQLEGKLK